MTAIERPLIPDHFTNKKEAVNPAVPEIVLQTRLLASGDALNPENTTLPAVTTEALQPNPEYTQTLLNRASFREREQAYPTIDANLPPNEKQQEIERRKNVWAEQFAQSVQGARGFYENTAQGKKHAAVLSKIGVDVLNFDQQKALDVYNRFCKNNDISTFINAVLEKYPDSGELQKDIAAFQWLGQMFGKQASEVTAQLLIARSKLKNETYTKILVSLSNSSAEENKPMYLNTISPGSTAEKQLAYLWKERRATDTLKPIAAKPPGGDPPKGTDPKPKDDEKKKPGPQEKQPEGPTPLEQRFNIIQGPVNRNHSFFVDQVPTVTKLNLTAQELHDLKSVDAAGNALPFFIDIKPNYRYKTNPKIVPFVYEIAQGQPNENVRFINGEKSTDEDSSLVGLAAASAENPTEQAKLYKTLVNSILDIHVNDPDFLSKWIKPGQLPDPMQPYSSFVVFAMHDHEKDANGKATSKLRSEKEQLLAYKPGETVFNDKLFANRWKNRIHELQTALLNDKLESHHLRWIEFLSHSVNVDGLMKRMKSKAETVPNLPEPPKAPESDTIDFSKNIPEQIGQKLKEKGTFQSNLSAAQLNGLISQFAPPLIENSLVQSGKVDSAQYKRGTVTIQNQTAEVQGAIGIKKTKYLMTVQGNINTNIQLKKGSDGNIMVGQINLASDNGTINDQLGETRKSLQKYVNQPFSQFKTEILRLLNSQLVSQKVEATDVILTIENDQLKLDIKGKPATP